MRDEESRRKVVALYRYLGELSRLRQSGVKNMAAQPWVLFRDDIPSDAPGVSMSWRDVTSDGEVDRLPLLEVSKPEFKKCPAPDGCLLEWLLPGWEDYREEARVRDAIEVFGGPWEGGGEEGQEAVTASFNDDPDRVEAYGRWTRARRAWVREQRVIRRVRDLFAELSELHVSLEGRREVLELMVGNGFVVLRDDPELNHPVLLKRVRTEFDAVNNVMRVVDTEDDPELYTTPLQEAAGLNLGSVQLAERELADRAYHPLDRNDTPDFLRGLVHRLTPQSEFSASPGAAFESADTRMRMYMRPVIFVRNHLDGTVRAISRIVEDVEGGGFIPSYLAQVVSGGTIEVADTPAEKTVDQRLAEVGGEDVDILLSKEANREQLEIARRVSRYNAVIVQGPPGTGKTHTIANLVGHFLSQGKTVLVTSHTSKALSVLKEKIGEGLRDLCVSVMDGADGDMEKAVDGITDYMGRHTSAEVGEAAESLERARRAVIERLAEVRVDMFRARRSEYESIVYEGEGFSPSGAARFVRAEAEALSSVIPGDVDPSAPFPLSPDELARLYESNALVGEEDERELGAELPDPSSLPEPGELAAALATMDRASSAFGAVRIRRGWECSDPSLGPVRVGLPAGSFELDPKSAEPLSRLSAVPASYEAVEGWQVKAAADGRRGGGYAASWAALTDRLAEARGLSEGFLLNHFGVRVSFSDDVPLGEVVEGLTLAKDVLARKGRIGAFDSLMHKGIPAALEATTVDGHAPKTEGDCAAAIDFARLLAQRAECERYWDSLMAGGGAPRFVDLDREAPERVAANWAPEINSWVSWYDTTLPELRSALDEAGIPAEAVLCEDARASEEESAAQTFSALSEVLPGIVTLCAATLDFRSGAAVVASASSALSDPRFAGSALCAALMGSVEARDRSAYRLAYERLLGVEAKRDAYEDRRRLISRLEAVAPGWAEAVRGRAPGHGGAAPPPRLSDAWKWKVLDHAVRRAGSTSLGELQEEAALLSAQYREATERLAEARAWQALLGRTERDVSLKQALQGWKQTVKKIGKGTGKRAPELKAEARRLMAKCRGAVPVWIMPVGRALESFDPGSDRFDIVIIDEASQSDVSALAVVYLARKAIVVGDDRQVSPMGVGVRTEVASSLRDMYIRGVIPNDHLYEPTTSLYDIAATTFQPLMLREHFRCMPEIIGFSNKLSYDFKIEPLRDPGSSTVFPSVVCHRVPTGAREGRRKTNPREAREIVSLMRACIEQPEYAGKTFGVISLLGEEQARLIQSMVVRQIPMPVIEERRIMCGISSAFQGDERDVVFLSLVDSGGGPGPLSLMGYGPNDSYRKRYNVAASRAKDQLWVVHSLDPGNDLKLGDIRRELIDYASDPGAVLARSEEAERKAESPFEAEVAKALLARGFDIEQQWRVGSFRIDIVVKCGGARIAVECDGERWHSSEEAVRKDMERQAILERLGWRFIRVRGSEYYRDPEACVSRIASRLAEAGFAPAERGGSPYGAQNSELLGRVRRRAQELGAEKGGPEGRAVADAVEFALGRRDGAEAGTVDARAQGSEPVRHRDGRTAGPGAGGGRGAASPAAAPPRAEREGTTPHAAESPRGDTDTAAGEGADAKKAGRRGKDPVAEKPSKGKTKKAKKKPAKSLEGDLDELGFEKVDKRPQGGSLWVVADSSAKKALTKVGKRHGVIFKYKAEGGRATKGRPAWWAQSR